MQDSTSFLNRHFQKIASDLFDRHDLRVLIYGELFEIASKVNHHLVRCVVASDENIM
jgi:hypothetical protein